MQAAPIDVTDDYRAFAAVTSRAPDDDVTAMTSPDDDVIAASAAALGYVYVLVTTLTSSLSMVGCALLVGADAAFRDLRTAGRRLLTWLSVADCLTAAGNLLGVTW